MIQFWSSKSSIPIIIAIWNILILQFVQNNIKLIQARKEVTITLLASPGDSNSNHPTTISDKQSESVTQLNSNSIIELDRNIPQQQPWKVNMKTYNAKGFRCQLNVEEAISKNIKGCFISPVESNNYWQYEVCLWQNVSQIHMENGKVSSRVLLGIFKTANDSIHYFDGGSGGRSATVDFVCDGTADLPRVTRGEEPKPLQYGIHVATKTACHKTAPSLSSVPCMERGMDGWRYRLCPGKSVIQTKEMENRGIPEIHKYDTFISRETVGRRKVEIYEGPNCSSNPSVKRKARVSYSCARNQPFPMIISIDLNGCMANLRVGLIHVCNTESDDVNCTLEDSVHA
jgi:hypothetical protein